MKQNDAESTVLSKPERAPAPKKSRKKRFFTVIALLIILFVVVPWLIVKFANGSQERTVRSFRERLADTTVGEQAETLYDLKNTEIGDTAATEKIIELLGIRMEMGEFTVGVKSDARPYRITLQFAIPHDSSRDVWFENTAVKYACALLALIPAADEIGWSYPSGEDADSGTAGGYFTKADAAEFLGEPISSYSASAKGIQLLMNQMGLNR